MFARLLKLLGFRTGESLEGWLERYERSPQESREAIKDAYLRENFSHLPEQQLAQDALRLWRAGQKLEALDAYGRVIEQAPDDSILLLNRAHLLVELGRFTEASSDFARARAGHPKLPDHVFAMQEALQNMSPELRRMLIERRTLAPEEIEEACRRLDSLKEPVTQQTHAEFILTVRQNPNSYRVNWILAFYAQRLLPWNYRAAWTCLSIVEWGTLLGGLALIIFRHWLIGLCLLAFCAGVVMPASRKTACQFILEYSLENEEFWRTMCETGVLVQLHKL